MLCQQDATCPDVSDDGTSIIIIKVLLQLLEIIGSTVQHRWRNISELTFCSLKKKKKTHTKNKTNKKTYAWCWWRMASVVSAAAACAAHWNGPMGRHCNCNHASLMQIIQRLSLFFAVKNMAAQRHQLETVLSVWRTIVNWLVSLIVLLTCVVFWESGPRVTASHNVSCNRSLRNWPPDKQLYSLCSFL